MRKQLNIWIEEEDMSWIKDEITKYPVTLTLTSYFQQLIKQAKGEPNILGGRDVDK